MILESKFQGSSNLLALKIRLTLVARWKQDWRSQQFPGGRGLILANIANVLDHYLE